jgi:hypothetical protein
VSLPQERESAMGGIEPHDETVMFSFPLGGRDATSSQAFHRAAGFEEVERIVCYRRDLTE